MQPLASVLNAVVPSLIANAPLTAEKVNFAWTVSVGPAIARATTVRLHGVTLRVSGEPAWLREIDRSHDLILGRLRHLLGQSQVRTLTCEP